MTKIEKRKEFDLDILLHPAGAYRTPMEIVNDPDITEQEKRALLCSWACNACAAEATSEPRGGTLRRPPGCLQVSGWRSCCSTELQQIHPSCTALEGPLSPRPLWPSAVCVTSTCFTRISALDAGAQAAGPNPRRSFAYHYPKSQLSMVERS